MNVTWKDNIVTTFGNRELLDCKNLTRVGDGFSGVVFRADSADGPVAIKIYDPALFEGPARDKNLTRFNQQSRLVGHECPYLVKLHQLSSVPAGHGRAFRLLLMDFVNGSVLTGAIREFPEKNAARVIAQIAQAAYVITKLGFVHHDIKPSNVIITKHVRATLLDPGYMHPLPSGFSSGDSSQFVHTTVRYTAPEHFREAPEDSADAWRAETYYQLGLLIHEMLGQKRVFDDENDDLRLVSRILDGVPRLKGRVAKSSLYALARDCLELKPNDRLEKVSWERFEYQRAVRRPTIVFLYTGGTIGANGGAIDKSKRESREIATRYDPLLKQISDRICRDHKAIYSRSEKVPFTIEWEILPCKKQLLSENATPDTWNVIADVVSQCAYKYITAPKLLADDPNAIDNVPDLDKLYQSHRTDYEQHHKESFSKDQFSEFLDNRHIVGIVVLHGTDTLAYSAAALTVAFDTPPIAIVLTGSNQPPNEKSLRETNIWASYSDAWRNLLRSVHFLMSLGHRYREVFVCFADRIHHGLNLRKLPIAESPALPSVVSRWENESFRFTTVARLGQYMFKCIDGIYCNNFYPPEPELKHEVFVDSARRKNGVHHIRGGPSEVPNFGQPRRFAECVYYHKISPLSAPPGISGSKGRAMLSDGRELRVLIVEGYPSGTFPSREEHSVHSTLKSLLKLSVPLVLIASDGVYPEEVTYVTEKVEGVTVPVLRLYGIIAETAVPMLSMLIGEIAEEDWYPHGVVKMKLLEKRHRLLKDKVQEFGSREDHMVHYILGDVTSVGVQRDRLVRARNAIEDRNNDIHERIGKLPMAGEHDGSLWSGEGAWIKSNDGPPLIGISRRDFLWIRQKFIEPSSSVGAAPDSFALHYEIGRSWGKGEAERKMANKRRPDRNLLSELDESASNERFEAVKQLPVEIAQVLRLHGIADIHCEPLKMLLVRAGRSLPTPQVAGFELDLEVRNECSLVVNEEIFSIHTSDSREREFWRLCGNGAPPHLEPAAHVRNRDKIYWELLRSSWVHRVSILDWFFFGVFKAVACNIAGHLLIDDWARRAIEASNKETVAEVFSAAVDLEVSSASHTGSRFRISYRALEEGEDVTP